MLKFTGHERDASSVGGGNTALPDYMHARYYDPSAGRFLSIDPVMNTTSASMGPQLWNRYVYVMNNPMRHRDPTGKYICNGTEAQCKAFEAARQDNLRSGKHHAALVGAAQAYGDPGKANGITVAFGNPGGRRSASVASHIQGNSDGSVSLVSSVVVRAGVRGNELRAAVAHEGSHIRDAKAFSDSITNGGTRWDDSLNLRGRQTETNAYLLTAQVANATNETFNFDGAKFLPLMAPVQLDQLIESVLASNYTADELNRRIVDWPEMTPQP